MTDREDGLAGVAALADPVRLRLYRVLEASDRPLGRDELAERTGIARATVAFHLERLVEAGVLTSAFAHRGDRRGPGSGRPAKFYEPAADEVTAAIPPRHYDLAADLLATAVERSEETGEAVRACLLAVARERGAEAGDPGHPLVETLEAVGYEPVTADEGGYQLANCPFHRLARRHTDLICAANVAYVEALSAQSSDRPAVRLEPLEGGCCVRVLAAPAETAPA